MKDEIIKALETDSSFSFEMEVLQALSNKKFQCDHSGLYIDPYTKKNREFDIRARLNVKDNWHINLAVECKKIDPESPLIIHSTMIPINDRVHSLIINYSNYKKESSSTISFIDNASAIYGANFAKALNHQVRYKDTPKGSFPSLTSSFEFVGRSMDQLKSKMVGKDKVYTLNDSEIHEKFSQAQHSLVEMIEDSYNFEYKKGPVRHQFFNLPILVVPNNTLWEQRYNPDGKKNGEPYPIKRVPFYINKTYQDEFHKYTPSFFLRFMEIVTFDGLTEFLETMLNTDDGFQNTVFLSEDDEQQAFNDLIKSKLSN